MAEASRKRLSLAMQDALRCATRYGALERFDGGFWSHRDAPIINPKDGTPSPWWAAGTIEALVNRGLLQVVATRAGGTCWARVVPTDLEAPDATV